MFPLEVTDVWTQKVIRFVIRLNSLSNHLYSLSLRLHRWNSLPVVVPQLCCLNLYKPFVMEDIEANGGFMMIQVISMPRLKFIVIHEVIIY